MTTHYDVLGVKRTASAEEIRRAYHQQARQWHPDRFVGKSDVETSRAEDAMRGVNEAFRVLGNNERRQRYNLELDGSFTGDGRIRVDDGVTRIDPRLLDPEFLAARRTQQQETLATHHSRMMNVIPWAGFLFLLAMIFVFTAYATGGSVAEPVDVTEVDIGVEVGQCIRRNSGGGVNEVPCTGPNDGVLLGTFIADGDRQCPQPQVPFRLVGDVVACVRLPPTGS